MEEGLDVAGQGDGSFCCEDAGQVASASRNTCSISMRSAATCAMPNNEQRVMLLFSGNMAQHAVGAVLPLLHASHHHIAAG
jgi:hypothetical protein